MVAPSLADFSYSHFCTGFGHCDWMLLLSDGSCLTEFNSQYSFSYHC